MIHIARRQLPIVGLLTLLMISALGGRAFAQQTVTMANGDDLTGQLLRIEGSKWVFQYQGQEISLLPDSITAFTAPEPIGIRLADTTIVAATVEPAEDGLRLGFADGTSRVVQPAEFVAVGSADDLQALEPLIIGLYSPFFKLWNFLVSMGGTIQTGNTDETNFAFTLDLGRETIKDRTEFSTLITTTKEFDESGQTTSTEPKIIVGLGSDIFITPGRLFAGVTMRWQHDPKKDLAFRQTYTGNLGYQIVNTDNTNFSLSLGAGGRFDNLTTDAPNTSTPILDTGIQFRQKAGPVLFRIRVSYNPSLEDFSNVELLDAYEIAINLISGLTFKWTLLHEFNNPPPSGDPEKNDLTMTFNLGWALGGD